MYLRTTQRKNKDGSIVRYVQLAHNRRDGQSTVAEVLVNFGREDTFVTEKSAYGVGPVSTGYFQAVFARRPTTAADLRADRLLAEAVDSGADPLRLVRLFALSPAAAMRYCAAAVGDQAREREHP